MAKTSLANVCPPQFCPHRLHRVLSGKRLVLTFTGRRSGTRYGTPVNYLQRGHEVLITTDSRWWHNLDGGPPVQLRLRGRQLRATAEAARDPDVVARALAAIVQDHPPYGRWAHIRVDADGMPDADHVHAEVTRGRVLIHVQRPVDTVVG